MSTDQLDRHLAATDFTANQLAVAGAGTGKTSLLIERALIAIAGAGLPVARIAAITYTEKAAAELRERLTEALEGLARTASGAGAQATGTRNETLRARAEIGAAFGRLMAARPVGMGLPPDEIAARSSAALEALDEAFVGTIHAFAADLLRHAAREARVDPYFIVDDGSRLARLHQEEWPRYLASVLGAHAEGDEQLWPTVLARFEPQEIEKLAWAAAREDFPLESVETGGDPGERAKRLLASPSRETARRLREILPAIHHPTPQGWILQALALLELVEEEGPGALAEADVAKEWWEGNPPSPRKRTYDGEMPLEEAEGRMKQARAFLRRARLVDEEIITLCLQAVCPYARRLREAARRGGFISFEGLLVQARDLLRDDGEVREEQKRTLDLILVDEFQDTDPLQYEIVLMLAERRGECASDPFRARLQPGKLFVVGDPKQSIYSFRGADIVACDRAVERIVKEGGRLRILRSNFRSRPEILAPLDVLFRNAFAEIEPPMQARYEPIEPDREPAGEPRIYVLSIDPPNGSDAADLQRSREGIAIAEEMVFQREQRGVRWSEMALLLPAMTVAPLYARGLREKRIPFVMEGGRSFGVKTEVRMMLALLAAVANSVDSVAFLAVARSPLGAAADQELARFVASGGLIPPREEVDATAFPAIARTQQFLSSLRRKTRGLPVDEAVALLVRETPLLPLAAVAYEGAQRVANLRTLASRAAAAAAELGLSLDATVEFLQEELARAESGETPLADEGLEAVRVLTVHKAKGLEFPVVFVADLRRRSHVQTGRARGESEARWWRCSAVDGAPAVRVRSRRSPVLSAGEMLRCLEDSSLRKAESVRSFYVACTRAKERLFLVASDTRTRGFWTSLLGAWGYDDGEVAEEGTLCGGQVIHRRIVVSSRAGQREVGGVDFIRAVESFDRARALAREAERPWIASPSSLRSAHSQAARIGRIDEPEPPDASLRRLHDLDEEEPDEPLADLDEQAEETPAAPNETAPTVAPSRIAAAAGTVVHALLELWDRKDADWIRRVAPALSSREASDRSLDLESVLREVNLILDGLMASQLTRRLAEIDLIGREVPVFHPEDGVLIQGIADLLYREPDGTVVVADHKTDLSTSGDVHRLLERYQPQLAAYVRALRSALPPGTPVRGELWLTRSGEILVVADPSES